MSPAVLVKVGSDLIAFWKLQAGQGASAAPQPHGCGPSQERSWCVSQTQPVSSHRRHFTQTSPRGVGAVSGVFHWCGPQPQNC
jgi:hypothetical protein